MAKSARRVYAVLGSNPGAGSVTAVALFCFSELCALCVLARAAEFAFVLCIACLYARCVSVSARGV